MECPMKGLSLSISSNHSNTWLLQSLILEAHMTQTNVSLITRTSLLSSLCLLVWTDLSTCKYWLVPLSFLGVDLQSPRLSLFPCVTETFQVCSSFGLHQTLKSPVPGTSLWFPRDFVERENTKSSPNISCLGDPSLIQPVFWVLRPLSRWSTACGAPPVSCGLQIQFLTHWIQKLEGGSSVQP